MPKFKCKRSGIVVDVTNQDDLVRMRINESYQEVKDAVQIEEVKEAPKKEIITIASIKKRGRPKNSV